MPAPPASKSEYVESELKRQIITGELPPGAKLDLDQLAKSLGVSKMPIRQALTQLQVRGLVEISPQRWTQVTPISIQEVDDTYRARRALSEMLAAQALPHLTQSDLQKMQDEVDNQREYIRNADLQAYVESDRAFHFTLYERADYPRSLSMVRELRDVAERYIYLFIGERAHGPESLEQHQAIIDSCRTGDVEELVRRVGEHIEHGRQELISRIASQSALPEAVGLAAS